MTAIYDKLLKLPLFQGMNQTDLEQVAGNTKFGFQRAEAGRKIALADAECSQLIFLMDGQLGAETQADDHGYTLRETVAAPDILQPERLFGLTPRFSRTFTAQTLCSIMTLDKEEVLRLLDSYMVFRLNFLNILSALCQRQQRRLLAVPPRSLESRIAGFVAERSLKPAGSKQLHIKMARLAQELGGSRIDISRTLNQMQDQQLLQLHRARIEIPALERLLQAAF